MTARTRGRRLTRRRAGVLAVCVFVAIVLAVAGARLLAQAGHSTPVALRNALADYRALQGSQPPAGRPAPGVYTYAVAGWECAGVGPICLHRTLPRRAYLIVARSGPLLTIQVELSLQHLEAQRYRLTGTGRLLTWQRTRITILGVTQDDAGAISPPTTLALPATLRPGVHWTQRFTALGLPVRSANLVTGRRAVPVAGRNLPAWRIVSDSVTGGAHPGTERDVSWHSQALGLDLRFGIHRVIGGTFPYRLQLWASLLGTAPAR